ncbi:nucleotidyltransferase family protein [Gymnodinialimonas ulvae]|uniref:nucleotidyltransferase family protein n=1 Tax=Gymnodinialimonas ulvae TaxID=3126504 RepID=UPI0030A5F323
MTAPCLILAAGFGTRMGALTRDRPKPLIEVAGQNLLDHALAVARGARCAPIAVNAHYRADQITDHLRDQSDVTPLIEAPDILDSGGAVKNAMAALGPGAIMTLNADNIWHGANPLTALSDAFDTADMGALLLLTPGNRAVGRQGGGDFVMDRDGRLTLDKSDDSLVYLGAQMLDPAPCYADPRDVFSLRDTWQAYAADGRLFGLIYAGLWADVGHPDGIALAEAMLETGDV